MSRLIQVTAYPLLDRLMVQCTTMEASGELRRWEHRILDQVSVGTLDSDWDLIWLIGQVLCDKAMMHQSDSNDGLGPR